MGSNYAGSATQATGTFHVKHCSAWPRCRAGNSRVALIGTETGFADLPEDSVEITDRREVDTDLALP